MSKSTKRILLVHTHYSTFVQADYDLLSEHYIVTLYHHRTYKKIIPYALEFLRVFFFLVRNISQIEVVFCWFADFHAFFPTLFARLFNKKSFVVVGGFDAVAVPEIKYGLFFNNKWRQLLAGTALRMTDAILAVDSTLIKGENRYSDAHRVLNTGVAHFIRNIENKCHTVPTGYDFQKWRKPEKLLKDRSVLTITSVYDVRGFKLKGLDLLFEAAQLLPKIEFKLVGLKDEALLYAGEHAPQNVELIGFLPHNELLDYYCHAKVFCLFSLSEGLPNTFCEAMLCECVPVGSHVGGIPTAISDTGFILEKRDARQAARLLQAALDADEKLGKMARQRIIDHFGVNKRKQALFELIEKG